MKITENIKYIGVNDHKIDLFESQYRIPNGMSYNSYIILDKKIAVFDTVDANFTHEWLKNVAAALNGRLPDYLIIQHMEPDHSSNILEFLKIYPTSKIIARFLPGLTGIVRDGISSPKIFVYSSTRPRRSYCFPFCHVSR